MKQFYHEAFLPKTLIAPYDYVPSNEQAAWFAIAYTAAHINGDIRQETRETFCRLIASNELFKGHEILDYFYEMMEVKDELVPKEIIRQAAKLVAPEHAPTLFCLVTETLLVKGYLTKEEEEILHYTGRKLSLEGDTIEKIIEVILLKNKLNCVYN